MMRQFRSILYRICNQNRLLLPVLSIALFIFGCTQRVDAPYLIVDYFPIEKQLLSSPLLQLEDCIGIIDVGTAGPYLVCREHKTKCHFTIYNSDFQMIGSWGLNGRGPNEYLAPDYYGQCEEIDSGIRFYVWERALHELDAIDIRSNGDSTSIRIAYKFKMPKNSSIDPRLLIRNSPNLFSGVTDVEDCRFFMCDSTFQNPTFAEHVLSFDNLMAHEIAQSCYGIKPDNSRVAIAYFSLPQIDIRTSDGKIVRTIFLNKIIHPVELDLNNLANYFLKVDANEHYIYALCEDSNSTLSGRNSILVFDWDGNPIAKYSVLRANSFAIDKQLGRIITVNADQTNSLCSIYPIS